MHLRRLSPEKKFELVSYILTVLSETKRNTSSNQISISNLTNEVNNELVSFNKGCYWNEGRIYSEQIKKILEPLLELGLIETTKGNPRWSQHFEYLNYVSNKEKIDYYLSDRMFFKRGEEYDMPLEEMRNIPLKERAKVERAIQKISSIT